MTMTKVVNGVEVPLSSGEAAAILAAQAALVPTFADRKAAKLAAINNTVATMRATGALYGGLHVRLDDSSIALINAIGATAGFASLSIMDWPEDYQLGFIAIENVRIPLPTPQDGINFAGYIGPYVARLRQNGRDLKDAVLAAEDDAELEAIDIEAGWPG